MLKKLTGFLLLAGAWGLLLLAQAPAQREKKVEKTDQEIAVERMQKLMTAYELAAEGRKKNAPEYLITAAGMMRRLSAIQALNAVPKSDLKPEISGDNAADKDAKAPTLREQSDEIFKEASDMGATLNVNVDKLIKIAKERETVDKEERAVVGGPKQVAKMIGPGQTHTYTYTMITTSYTQWCFNSNFPLQVTVVHKESQTVWVSSVTTYAAKAWPPFWHPNPKAKQTVVITIRNPHKQQVQYQKVIQ
jgi:hypothetical protein